MKNQIAHLDHIHFTVNSLKETVQWYNKIFHFQLVEQGIWESGDQWGILRSGNNMLAITEVSQRDIYKGKKYHQTYHFGIRLKNRQEWEHTIHHNALDIMGGEPVVWPHSTSWYIQDPTGHMIEVVIWNDNKIQFPK